MKELYSELRGLFPTPLFVSYTNKEFTKKEISFLKKKKLPLNILNNKILKNIKKEVVLATHNYFYHIEKTSSDLNFDIYQSWVEVGHKNKPSHDLKHSHRNSFLSGFLYIDAAAEKDRLSFIKDQGSFFEFTVKQNNVFNCSTWEVPVESKKIIIFPSYVPYIFRKQNKQPIMAIGFNIFLNVKTGKVSDLIAELIK